MDILEEDDFLNSRRKLLRQRAGLTDQDKRKAIFSAREATSFDYF